MKSGEISPTDGQSCVVGGGVWKCLSHIVYGRSDIAVVGLEGMLHSDENGSRCCSSRHCAIIICQIPPEKINTEMPVVTSKGLAWLLILL